MTGNGIAGLAELENQEGTKSTLLSIRVVRERGAERELGSDSGRGERSAYPLGCPVALSSGSIDSQARSTLFAAAARKSATRRVGL
jgi:hypothetical protein